MTTDEHVALALCSKWSQMKDSSMPLSKAQALALGRAAVKAAGNYLSPEHIARLEAFVDPPAAAPSEPPKAT